MATKIIPCTCKNEYQDTRYGKNMRVMNQCVTPPQHPTEWRCTVCETVRKVERPTEKGQ